jgi:hypothetical protein
MVFILLWCLAWFPMTALAGVNWGLNVQIHSISTAVSEGAGESKFSGLVLPELRPEVQWDLSEGQEQLRVWLQASRFQFDSGSKNLLNNGQFFLGGGASWGRYFSPGHLSVGLILAQRPVWESRDPTTWNLRKTVLLSVPVEAKTKMLVLENQVIGLGANITPLLLGISRSGSGYSAGAFIEYERRARQGAGLRLFYEVREMTFTNLNQSEVVLGASGRFSFGDSDSDFVPLDERD